MLDVTADGPRGAGRLATVRGAVVAAAVCAAVASCSVTTGGHGVGAATLGHAPQPVTAGALSDLLLGTSDAGAVMGARLNVSACAMNVADRGAQLAQRIADKINDQ